MYFQDSDPQQNIWPTMTENLGKYDPQTVDKVTTAEYMAHYD